IEELAPDMILASPINTGSGHVRCSHGILPVPAPATAYILQNVPIYNDEIKGELCTPTGAALLKHFVKEFGKMPVLAVAKTGYGMGKKDFEKANCVRAFAGSTAGGSEEVVELICNLDDMTPEAVTFAQQVLLDEGVLDVWTAPIGMKKGRTGVSFCCMCRNDQKDAMAALMFKHTTTLGIRELAYRRHTLQREHAEFRTKYGTIRVKTACGFGVKKSKPEYEDVAKIAREKGISMQDVLKEM
ncbi:MAG: LarC family nickel insertion protein, partial [Treponema sp.]|nr:LarC family nickel insertion protein [Treponema sp.]